MNNVTRMVNNYWIFLTFIMSCCTFAGIFYLMTTNDRDHKIYDQKILEQKKVINLQQKQIERLETLVGL